MGRITKNYIYNLIYQVIVLIVPLVTAPYLAEVLGPKGTGTYSYVHSMTSIICTFSLLGIFNYGNRQIAYVRDDKEKVSQTFWQIISARLIMIFFGTFAYFLIVFFIGKYTRLFAIYYTFLFASSIDCTWLYVGVEDMKWAVIKNTITKSFVVIGIFAFVKTENDTAIYILIQGLSLLLSNTLAYSQVYRYAGKPHLDFSRIKKDLIGSLMLFLPSVASTIYLQCDKIMIELMTGATDEVSFYDYSEKIVTIPLTFITVLSSVMMPRIANEFKKNHQETISTLLNKGASFSLFLACPMMLGLMAVADKLIPWYLGEEFEATIYAIILISPIIVSNTLTGVSGGQYFTATNQIKILLRSQIAAVIGNVVINAVLIPIFGFLGAAIATLITNFICAGVQYFYLLKQIKLPGLMKTSARYAVVSLLMFALIRLVTGSMDAVPLTNVIQVILGGCFYMGVCLLVKDKQAVFFYDNIKTLLYRKTDKGELL